MADKLGLPTTREECARTARDRRGDRDRGSSQFAIWRCEKRKGDACLNVTH